MKEKCYILGSSESLLNLTIEEKEILNSETNVLAMNKYLIFNDIIGVYPKDLFLIDSNLTGIKVLLESLDIARKNKNDIRFFLGEGFRKLFNPLFNEIDEFLKLRFKLIFRHSYIPPMTLNYDSIKFFEHVKGNKFDEIKWAYDFNDELCFYRGSLSTAINLCTILYPNCDIYLVGIDLNTPYSFYQHHEKAKVDYLDTNIVIQKETGLHATAIKTDNYPGIIDYFPKIIEKLNEIDVNIYSTSSKSLFITQGICEFKPIL